MATENRQNEANRLSKEVDMVIVIGGKNSSNTKKLYEVSEIIGNLFCGIGICLLW